MAIVIVTKRCYLICEDILSITLNQREPAQRQSILLPGTKRKKPRLVKKPKPEDTKYGIDILYVLPTKNRAPGYGEQQSLTIEVVGKNDALMLFAEIVKEIREQKPDQLYLDKLVEKMLGDELEFEETNDD